MSDHQGQGHHKGESTLATLKRTFGWDTTPKLFKNPFFLGFLGTLFVGMTLLSDRIEPEIELSKRDRELREEMMLQARDRQRLAKLAKEDHTVGQVLETFRDQEASLNHARKDQPL